MKIVVVAFAVLLFFVAPGFAFQDEELTLTITASTTKVAPGDRFSITVERRYSDGLVVEPWTSDLLAPLTLEEKDRRVRHEGERTIETTTFDAYAFVRKDILIRAPVIRAQTQSGETRVGLGEDLAITVVPRLDVKNPGAIEMPGPIREETIDRRRLLVVSALGVVTLLFAFRFVGRFIGRKSRQDRRREIEASLLQLAGDSESADGHYFLRLTEVVRDAIDVGCGIRAPWMTTIEFLRATEHDERIRSVDRAHLARFLESADLVKFADRRASAADRSAAHAHARTFVTAAFASREGVR